MKKLKNIILIILLSISSNALALKVGVTSGPHAIIMKEVEKEAKKEGLEVKIVEFNDFILPNESLADGSIDANSYQHLPFLEETVKNKGYKIISIAKTIILPLGIYSHNHKSLGDLIDGAKISIPNDPTNGGRALLLLEKLGMIKLKASQNPSVLDIVDNPHKLQIVEIEAPQIPRILEDVDYGVTNTDWILTAGMNPSDALAREDKDSPYANIIAVRAGDENRTDIKKLISIYHSKVIKDFINNKFKGAVMSVW
jgi:D-methionine transport system substrate-binding protein